MRRYVQRFDVEPQFWQFLRGLSRDDLVTELIQNELDARSTHTTVSFEIDRLTCQGNGDRIDDGGWKRLGYVQGAGNQVPRKAHQIGVKNHGIKTCFTIGDEICIRSDGKMIKQTLHMNGTDRAPSPGTYDASVADPDGPSEGCLIEVPYRVRPLTVNVGEPLSIGETGSAEIEDMFVQACREAPRRFIGALRPDVRRQYVLELVHHRMGTARFEFSCRRMKTVPGLTVYSRTCCASGTVPELPEELTERACSFGVPIPKGSNREIPDFYAAKGGRFLSEISWRVNNKGMPVPEQGHRRYPIQYRGTDRSALTGLGVSLSAPYSSDLERHGAIMEDVFNQCVERACKSELVKALRSFLMPRHGVMALNLILDPERTDEETMRDMVELLLEKRALPVTRRRLGPAAKSGRPHKGVRRASLRFGPGRSSGSRVVLPMFDWEDDKLSPLLAQLCPCNEYQIHPQVPGPILRLLGDGESKGWGQNHVTFDEADALNRLQPLAKAGFFPWGDDSEWRGELGDPRLALLYLDTLEAVYSNNAASGALDGVRDNAYLPDASGTPVCVTELHRGIDIPSGLPIGGIPPILSPDIARHRVFRRKAWRIEGFTFDRFIEVAAMDKADEHQRASFWRWLKGNWHIIKVRPQNPWPALASMPIWPDTRGGLHTLSALCRPGKSMAAILGDNLNIPHADVFKIDPVKKAKRGALHIRSLPTQSEFLDFLRSSLSAFPKDRPLSADERDRFHTFERDLAVLASHREIRSYLRESCGDALGLSRSGCVRPVQELVYGKGDTSKLHLANGDLLERRRSVLDRIDSWRPRSSPTSEQVLRALQSDPDRYSALHQRLRAYLQAAKREQRPSVRHDISTVECIPDGGALYGPGSLAFLAPSGDYWGQWKHRISGQGLSANVQHLYKEVGVLGTQPASESSREFFQWLCEQQPSIIHSHLACVIRHINHKNGPMSWSEEYPEAPFIPVEAGIGCASLVSRSHALGPRSMTFIPDDDALADAIRAKCDGVMLVITRASSVSAPATQPMRRLGVKSLSDFAGSPISVHLQEEASPPQSLIDELDVLRSRTMSRELQKRLDDREVDLDRYKLRTNWRERLTQIASLTVAQSVSATFRVGRKRYTVPREAAFDEQSGVISLVGSIDDLDDLFYSVIADRVFENPPRFLRLVLRDAVRGQLRTKGVSVKTADHPDDEGREDTGGEWNGNETDDGADDEPGGAERTHRGGHPDRGKNIPHPGKIPTGITGRGRRNRSDQRPSHSQRVSPPNEQKQIDDLKRNQYAWHCQVCLAEHTVGELAPVNSYVEIQENRRELIVAAHVDQVHAGGAMHAGNILILCSYHHKILGDCITRPDVTKALKETASDHCVVFPGYGGDGLENVSVPGKIITIAVPEYRRIRCFFTEFHSGYWLNKAGEA